MSSRAREQQRALHLLTAILGAPLHERGSGFYRWRCPVCGGGFADAIWRPLVLVEARADAADGRLYCEASLGRGGKTPTCNFTAAKLEAAITRLQEAA